mmetsp:Transcript_35620/g.26010  ORF Transcript_35620/g.26010 Transcript_35620/m.26010 type:complete len:125 (-) Transcript_35620:405-779(-)
MKKILRNYHHYLTNINPESLMMKILGIHKVIFYRKKHKMSKKIYFCIMNNVFNTTLKIDYRYDLKGSLHGRRTLPINVDRDAPIDPTIALKDLDFNDRGEIIKIGAQNRARLLHIIKQDTTFFE